MSVYKSSQWKEFRNNVIELDGNKCTICGKSSEEAILQIHHLNYIKGRLPWEYGYQECTTLCKGCHAAEHGIIMPKIGWEYVGDEDLGDLIGSCEYCDTSIRYIFYIFHENWGTLEVGTYCCDKLTDSNLDSNLIESQTSYRGRKQRFINSKRWKFEDETIKIKQNSFDIEIIKNESYYNLKIFNLESQIKYESIIDAKSKAFDVLESGEFIDYLKRNNIKFEEKKKK